MKRIFFLLLVLLAFLVGCSEDHPSYTKHLPQKTTALDDRISMDAVVSAENLSYSRMQLEIPERFAKEPIDSRLFSFTKDDFYVPMQYTNNTQGFLLAATILKYDKQGVLTDEIPVPAETYHAKGISVLSDGRFVIYRDMSERGHTHQKSFLQIFDAEGLLLAECNVPPFSAAVENDLGQLDYQSLLVDEAADGTVRILINAVDRVFLYDEALTLLAEYPIPGECKRIFRESDGVYILGIEMPHLYRLDCQAETVTQIKTLPIPPEFYYSSQFYWDFDGKMYCVSDGAIYLCEETDDAAAMKKILTWTSGPSSGRGLFWMFHDGAVICLEESVVLLDQSLYFLGIGGGRAVGDRQVISVINAGAYHQQWILELVAVFNAENDDYYIDLLDLSETKNGQTAPERLKAHLLHHDFPDIVLFNTPWTAQTYAEKGVLLDLSPYYGDTLIGCASTAYRDADGMQYALPLTMWIDTYAAADAVQSEPLTWEDLFAWEPELSAMSATERIAVFSASTYLDVYSWQDFYDEAAQTASFDTGIFEERTQLLERLTTDYTTFSPASLSVEFWTYALSRKDLLSDVQTGAVRLLQVPFDTIDAYAALKFIYADTPFTLCGLPTEDGGAPGVYLTSFDLVGISDNTEHLDGCLAFLDFALSDEVQTSRSLTMEALPVTRSAMEAVIAEHRYTTISPTSAGGGKYQIQPVVCTEDDARSVTDKDHATAVILTDEDCELLLDFFETCSARTNVDVTILGIIEEELSAYQSGVRTLSDAAKLIQSRVWIYVNE